MIAALFDFDGTLYTGHIWQDLVRHHRTAKRHRRWVAAYVVWNMTPWPLYKLGLLSQVTYYRIWGETLGWLIRGWRVEEAQALFERQTEEQILPNLRPDVLERLRQHQAEGHLVALVSGTFAPWLETVARRMEMVHAIGTPLETRDGRFTGRIIPPLCQGPGKPSRVKDYLAEHDLEVDWAASYAYGDSGPDLYLLNEVGHPVAVYPDEVLRAHVQVQDWAVMEGAD